MLEKIYNHIKSNHMKYREIINYLIFGVLTTIVNYVVYLICAKMFLLNVETSTIVAWILSVLFAYITNAKFVFDSKVKR